MALNRFILALNNVGNEYFTNIERLFTYELFHQLRIIIEYQPFDNENIILDCEIPKNVITTEQANALGILPLDSLKYPDFIIHERETAVSQLLVAEVKATKNLSRKQTVSDIRKLISFIRLYRFNVGVFVATNVTMERIITHMNHPETQLSQEEYLHIDRVHVLTKNDTEQQWTHMTLVEILQNNN